MTGPELATTVFRNAGMGGEAGPSARFVAVPGRGEARWLIPARAEGASRTLASWTPYRMWSGAAWAAVRVACELGGLAELPGVRSFEAPRVGRNEWEALGWRWKGEPTTIIYIGTPGPRRKAVVHLVERQSGLCRAVVKVPLGEAAREAILHEARMLAILRERGFSDAPRLLHVDKAGSVATQEFVEGRSGSRKFERDYWPLLRSLRAAEGTTSLSARVDAYRESAKWGSWAIDELQDDAELPLSWEHGDFAPWNIRRRNDGRCALLDWENARQDGLPLMDAFHFLHTQDLLFGKVPQIHWQSVVRPASEFGLRAQTVRKLEIAYLLDADRQAASEGNMARQIHASKALELVRRDAA